MELGSVTLKRIGLFCFPIKHSTHTSVRYGTRLLNTGSVTLKRVGLFFSPTKHTQTLNTHSGSLADPVTQDLWQLAVRYRPGRPAHISLMCPTSRPTLRLGHTGSRVPASSSDASVSRLLPPPPTQPPPLAPLCCCFSLFLFLCLCLLHSLSPSASLFVVSQHVQSVAAGCSP